MVYDFFVTYSGTLQAKTIGTSLVFAVGSKEVPSFRMIERHYFRFKLFTIRSNTVRNGLKNYLQGQIAEIFRFHSWILHAQFSQYLGGYLYSSCGIHVEFSFFQTRNVI
jgi:hypothetical protein